MIGSAVADSAGDSGSTPDSGPIGSDDVPADEAPADDPADDATDEAPAAETPAAGEAASDEVVQANGGLPFTGVSVGVGLAAAAALVAAGVFLLRRRA